MKPVLETDRMTLRRFRADDEDHLFDLDDDPAVMRFLTGGAGTPRETIRRQILPRFVREQDDAGVCGFWAAELKSNQAFAGWFTLRPLDGLPGQASLGYRLVQSVWGNGYATEGSRLLIGLGFEKIGFKRIIATTYEENAASIAVMRRLGMGFCRSFQMSKSDVAAMDTAAPDPQTLFPGSDVEYEILRSDWQHNSTPAKWSGTRQRT